MKIDDNTKKILMIGGILLVMFLFREEISQGIRSLTGDTSAGGLGDASGGSETGGGVTGDSGASDSGTATYSMSEFTGDVLTEEEKDKLNAMNYSDSDIFNMNAILNSTELLNKNFQMEAYKPYATETEYGMVINTQLNNEATNILREIEDKYISTQYKNAPYKINRLTNNTSSIAYLTEKEEKDYAKNVKNYKVEGQNYSWRTPYDVHKGNTLLSSVSKVKTSGSSGSSKNKNINTKLTPVKSSGSSGAGGGASTGQTKVSNNSQGFSSMYNNSVKTEKPSAVKSVVNKYSGLIGGNSSSSGIKLSIPKK